MTEDLLPRGSAQDSPRVLVVDDELSLLSTLTANLELEGFEVIAAESAKRALDLLREKDVDLVLTDVRMPGMNGVELFHELRATRPDLPVVLMTAFAAEGLVDQALAGGAFTYLSKPFTMEHLAETLLRAMRRPLALIVDGDMAVMIADALSAVGIRAEATSPGAEAHRLAMSGRVDVCVVPIGPDPAAVEALLRTFDALEPPLPVIAIAGPSVTDLAERLHALRAVALVREPVDVAALARLIARTRGVQRPAARGAMGLPGA